MLNKSVLKKIVMAFALLAAAACANPPVAEQPAKLAAAPKPLEITEASFGCIRDMKAVRGYFVGNLLGDVDATVAVANGADGGKYPPGSVVQLVPGEAMVKHYPGYNAATNDWEFFELTPSSSGTKIHVRGATEVVNQFGGNCLSCHAMAESKWDMICEQTHGCTPIPVTPVMAKAIQNTDPRCPKVDLPPEQQAAMKQLMAFLAASRKPAN